MTVAELIAALQKMPGEAVVYVLAPVRPLVSVRVERMGQEGTDAQDNRAYVMCADDPPSEFVHEGVLLR